MHELISRLLLYGVTAGVAAVVDVGGFALLSQAKIDLITAAASSFCVAALVNYQLTSHFVFRHQPTVPGFLLFLCAAIVGLSVNVGITLTGVLSFGLPAVIAKLLGIATAFLINFALNVFVIFRPQIGHQISESALRKNLGVDPHSNKVTFLATRRKRFAWKHLP